jgi:Domain of unknown function (DUF4105)
MTRFVSTASRFLLGLLLAATGGWGVLALYISGPNNGSLRVALAAGFAVAAVVALLVWLFSRRPWSTLAAYLVLFTALLTWWQSLAPSNERDWQPNVAKLAWAAIDGNTVTLHNIRNFSYRSETDFTPAWYDKTYDLRQLEGVDIVASYWMGPDIAHVFVSFGFAGGEHLAMSIETRTEKGEGYDTIKGFFRQYELYYVVADERDVIGLRTNYRRDPPEDVYVYKVKGSPQALKKFFLSYLSQINALKDQPKFYNTLTTNCTTSIWFNSLVNPEHLRLNWKIFASGHVPELLHEQGRLQDDGLPFAALQQRAHINARAQAAGISADFSQRIRQVEPTTK